MATKTAKPIEFMLSKLDVDGTAYEYKIEEKAGRYRGHCTVAGTPLTTDWRVSQRAVPAAMVKLVREKVASDAAEKADLARLRAWNQGLPRNVGGGV